MSILGRLLGSDGIEKCYRHHDKTVSWISVLYDFMWKNIHFGIPIAISIFSLLLPYGTNQNNFILMALTF